MSGYVSSVGKTSLEITAMLEQEVKGKMEILAKTVFLMAARNATNTGSAFVNPLISQNEAETEVIRDGEGKPKHIMKKILIGIMLLFCISHIIVILIQKERSSDSFKQTILL